jgi:hypothetical protein
MGLRGSSVVAQGAQRVATNDRIVILRMPVLSVITLVPGMLSGCRIDSRLLFTIVQHA